MPTTTRITLRQFNYTLKICGKRHAICKVCRPDFSETMRMIPPWNKGVIKDVDPRVSSEKLRAHLKRVHELNRGTKRPPETGARISATYTPLKRFQQAQRALENMVFPQLPTSLEYALQLLLESAGLEFEAQRRFGRYVVDAYVPSHNLVFEADGQFWYAHKNKTREQERDHYLLSRGVTAVIHLTENDLNLWMTRNANNN